MNLFTILTASVFMQAASPDSVPRCDATMVPTPAFRPHDGLKLLITRHHGASKESRDFAADLGFHMERAVLQYAASHRDTPALRDAGLTPEDLQVHHVPCLVNSHDEARAIGLAWGADAVMWGQAHAAPTPRRALKRLTRTLRRTLEHADNLTIASNNQVVADTVEIVGIKLVAHTTSRFRTSLTVVPWPGLAADADRSRVLAHATAIDLGFPELAPANVRALLHVVLAMNAARRHRHAVAAILFEHAMKLPGFAGHHHPDIQRLLGTSLMIAGQSDRSLAVLTAALADCPAADRDCRGLALYHLALSHIHHGSSTTAIDLFTRALALFRETGRSRDEVNALTALGVLHHERGDRILSLDLYQQALALCRRDGGLPCQDYTLNNIGMVHRELGDSALAFQFLTQALAASRAGHDREGEALALNNLGLMHSDRDELPQALEHYDQALALHRKIGDLVNEASVLNNIAGVHDSLGDRPKALEFYFQSLALVRRAGDTHGESYVLHNLGYTYDKLDDRTKALAYYEQSLALSLDADRLRQAAGTHDEIARIHRIAGAHGDAVTHYLAAARLYLALMPPDIKEATSSLRVAFKSVIAGRLVDAGPHVLQALRDAGISGLELAEAEARLASLGRDHQLDENSLRRGNASPISPGSSPRAPLSPRPSSP